MAKSYEMAMLVVLKGDYHDCSIRVSDCSIRVSQSLLQMGSHGLLSMNPTTPMCLLKLNCACTIQIMAKISLSQGWEPETRLDASSCFH